MDSSGCSTLVDDEDDGLSAQGVVQRHHHHGVGVAGELADDPLQENMSESVRPTRNSERLRWWTRYLGSVLGEDAHKGVTSDLQAPLEEARTQMLRPV